MTMRVSRWVSIYRERGSDLPQPDNAGVRIPPPFIFFIFLAIGVALNSAWIEGRLPPLHFTIIGSVLFLAAAFLLLTAARTFSRAGTRVEPWKPTTRIVSDGPYRHTRNPMYLGLAMAYAGIAVAAESPLALLFLIPTLLIIQFYVVKKEEAYLEDKFGKEYLDYKAGVRRWL